MQDFFLTQGLTQNQREEVLELLDKPQKFKRGELIYSEQSFLKAAGVILSGSVVIKTADDGTVVMRTLQSGAAFGASAPFMQENNFASRIYAAQDCEILFLSEEKLQIIFEKYPITAVNFIKLLSAKIQFLNKKIRVFANKSTTKRVYEYVLSLCKDTDEVEISNMSAMGKTLGIGRSSLYRSIDTLSEQGLIQKQGKKVKVIYDEKNC